MNEQDLLFEQFWEASVLNSFNVGSFAAQLSSYDSDTKQLLQQYPLRGTPLGSTRSKLSSIARQRSSSRTFSGSPLTKKELTAIFTSFRAWNGLEHRSYPSAGATYATEIYGLLFASELHAASVVYYDPEDHALIPFADAPAWQEVQPLTNISVTGTPQALIVFVLDSQRVTEKYGERGGRFALIEVGAALQMLSLQLADSKQLGGVAVGGLFDAAILAILGLDPTRYKVAVGYLVGK